MKKIFIACLWTFYMPFLWAQTVGTCSAGKAEQFLDSGNVRARITNTGGLFMARDQSNSVYELPRGSGINIIGDAGIMMGGFANNEQRIAMTRYQKNPEFFPGPLDKDGNPPADCTKYDRIWKITRNDIEAYNSTHVPSTDLAEWPWQLGAPVADGDGIPTNYNLGGGDRPELIGDQLLWWVMNDTGNIHKSSKTDPLGVEIQVSAFVFGRAQEPYLKNATFYRYKILYKSKDKLEKTLFGIWADPNLGDKTDDYAGSDTTASLSYVYNAYSIDGSNPPLAGSGHYGINPPAMGITMLKGLTGRKNQLYASWFPQIGSSDWNWGEPYDGIGAYAALSGTARNGREITVGGDGRTGVGKITRFMFHNDPPNFWSEENQLNSGSTQKSFPGDRRMIVSTGMVTLNQGDTAEILWGIMWARGTDHWDSVYRLQTDAQLLSAFYPSIFVYDQRLKYIVANEADTTPVAFATLAQNYPNPTQNITEIAFRLAQDTPVKLTVFDILGREIQTMVNEVRSAGIHTAQINTSDLPNGVYLYRLDAGAFSKTMKMTVQH